MSRRISPRRPRRVQVQFWKRGEPHAYPGYTTNISLTGMFIGTRSPLPPGTRLRIEVLEGDRGFMVEGVVMHARKCGAEIRLPARIGSFCVVETWCGNWSPLVTARDLPAAQAEPLPPLEHGSVEREPTGILWDDPKPSPRAALVPPPPRGSVLQSASGSRSRRSRPREGAGTFASFSTRASSWMSTGGHRDAGPCLDPFPAACRRPSTWSCPPFPTPSPVVRRGRPSASIRPATPSAPTCLPAWGRLLDLPTVVDSLQPSNREAGP